MLPESPILLPGFQAFATPGTLPPSVTAPHLRPLPSTGITRLLQYYEPLRHPAGPASPSRGPGSVRASPPTGLPHVAAFFSFHACQRHYPGGSGGVPASLASPSVFGLPHFSGGSAPALPVSRPARRSLAFPARMFAEPPYAALCHQGASDHIVASMIRPGCYQPERQLLDGFRTR